MPDIKDDELDEIRQRDFKRKKRVAKCDLPGYKRLVKILESILYARGVNNGNLYADTLAKQLLETGEIVVTTEDEKPTITPSLRHHKIKTLAELRRILGGRKNGW